ncbi:hypothetical protein LIQ46_06215 [Megasphaera elsdenii]|uniref:hypothetical protein n=1 Tax=Megasphaera elsdenii TaxID=907 RepID=UPI001D01D7B9|nr:hypothetical protein [Megasphaera elsdenii]MCB5727330.1 hypothetical protein [Megasphaera elsdenii]
MLLDVLLALSLSALTLTALLPLVGQTACLDRRCQIEEGLLRQHVSLEETLFQALRYGRDIEIGSDEVRFHTTQGRPKGFAVRHQNMYVRLSDGNYQPLTGGGSTVKGRTLVIQPLDGRPFFSRTGQAVQVAFLLTERRSGLSRPVQFAVWPLNEGES